jgi:hypothetical protein
MEIGTSSGSAATVGSAAGDNNKNSVSQIMIMT